jgi:uncharacterized protein (TIGR00251 family)
MLGPAIRFVAAKGVKIQLLCHVKPGVNAKREGIASVSASSIEVCVASQAKDGEANKAVREVIAHALRVPKSDIEVIKGMKSREKTVTISITEAKHTPEEEINQIRVKLLESIWSRE